MPEGVRTVSFAGRKVREFKPLQPGEKNARLIGAEATIKKSDKKPGAVPYVLVPFEILGTAEVDGGRNRRLNHMFFLSTEPQSDGTIRHDAEDQLVALAQAIGKEPEFGEVPYATFLLLHRDQKTGEMRKARDGETVDSQEPKNIHILSPDQVKDWLIANDGAELRVFIKTQKGTGGYPDKSVIGRFVISETVLNEASSDDGALFSDDGAGLEAEPSEEEVEEAPKPKAPAPQAKRTPPPPAKKPNARR